MTTRRTPQTVPSSPVMACCTVHIHLDADRDGVVDDNFARNRVWSRGASAFGAIIAVNCDNDDGKSNANALLKRDIADSTINGADDLNEIAPLDLRKVTTSSLNGSTVTLAVADTPINYADYIRIFDGRVVGSSEIIGPGTDSKKVFADADFDANGRIELGMEALKFPSKSLGATGGNPDFNGRIELLLTVTAADGTVTHTEKAVVAVAPWLIFNHMDITEKVYVAEQDYGEITDNTGVFIPALSAIVGSKLEVIPKGETAGDRWMQDIMELGYSSFPNGHSLTTTIRTPRQRDANDLFATYPGRKMLGKDFGYYETNRITPGSSLDSFGNLECSPPVPGYPLGRVVYGVHNARGHTSGMKQQMRELLEGQGIQDPIQLDTGWLTVGHVDEFLSFIPDASGTHGFKIAFASSRRAVEIVRSVQGTTPAAPLFTGIKNNDGSILTHAVLGGIAPAYLPRLTSALIMADAGFLRLQDEIQTILDAQKAILKRALQITDADFIDLPILFQSDLPGLVLDCIALTPGSVNMLVVTNSASSIDLVIPKPFGPMVAGACMFEAEILRVFGANAALTPHFVDCFLTYHVMQGEVHCGTNSKRVPPTTRWWH